MKKATAISPLFIGAALLGITGIVAVFVFSITPPLTEPVIMPVWLPAKFEVMSYDEVQPGTFKILPESLEELQQKAADTDLPTVVVYSVHHLEGTVQYYVPDPSGRGIFYYGSQSFSLPLSFDRALTEWDIKFNKDNRAFAFYPNGKAYFPFILPVFVFVLAIWLFVAWRSQAKAETASLADETQVKRYR